MSTNPYLPPVKRTSKQPRSGGRSWRFFWSYAALISFLSMLAGGLLLYIFESGAAGNEEEIWFILTSAVISLLILVAFLLSGIFTCLWLLSPKDK